MTNLLMEPVGSGPAPMEVLIGLWFTASVYLIGIGIAAARGNLSRRGKLISGATVSALGLAFTFPFGPMLDVGCLIAAALMIYLYASRLLRWPEKAFVLVSAAWLSFLLVASVAQVSLSRVHPLTLPEAKAISSRSLETYCGRSHADVTRFAHKQTEHLPDGAWMFSYVNTTFPKDNVYFIVDRFGNVEREGGR